MAFDVVIGFVVSQDFASFWPPCFDALSASRIQLLSALFSSYALDIKHFVPTVKRGLNQPGSFEKLGKHPSELPSNYFKLINFKICIKLYK